MRDTDFPTESSVLNQPDIPAIEIRMANATSSFKFMQDGRVFWKDREIVGDDEFKAAVVELSKYIVQTSTNCSHCYHPTGVQLTSMPPYNEVHCCKCHKTDYQRQEFCQYNKGGLPL